MTKFLDSYFLNACTDVQKIGIEWEVFAFDSSHTRLPYRSDEIARPSMLRIMEYLIAIERSEGLEPHQKSVAKHSWKPLFEIRNNERVLVGLLGKDRSAISLEPGGQFEYSTPALLDLHAVFEKLKLHKKRLQTIEEAFPIVFTFDGYDALSSSANIPWMPKVRYDIMRRYMRNIGQKANARNDNSNGLGHHMMQRTCTLQINLDYKSEEDMVKKMRVSLAIQPIIAAFFNETASKTPNEIANIKETLNSIHFDQNKIQDSFDLSMRALIWRHTDKERCGLLPFVFEKNFDFSRYKKYLLDLHMYFIKRGNYYIDKTGETFKNHIKFVLAKVSHLPNGHKKAKKAAIEMLKKDFASHATTAFPEVRLKPYIELRSFDSMLLEKQMILISLWVGLLYDEKNLNELHEEVMSWQWKEINSFYKNAYNNTKDSLFKEKKAFEYMKEWKEKARHGLIRRHYGEEKYLE